MLLLHSTASRFVHRSNTRPLFLPIMDGIIEQHLLNLPTLLLGPSSIDWCFAKPSSHEPSRRPGVPQHLDECCLRPGRSAPFPPLPLFFFLFLLLLLLNLTSLSLTPAARLRPFCDSHGALHPAIFHATLLYYTQKLGRIRSRTWPVLSLAYHHLLPHDNSLPSTRYFLYTCHVSFLLIVVLFIPSVFCSVHLALCILFCFRSVFLRGQRPGPIQAPRSSISRTFRVARACTILGFGAWIVD